jgi:hypothetical protein
MDILVTKYKNITGSFSFMKFEVKISFPNAMLIPIMGLVGTIVKEFLWR